MQRSDKLLSLEEKCLKLEEELQMSNQTILSLLEQGVEAKEVELNGGGIPLRKGASSVPSAQVLTMPASQQLPLLPNPLWEPQGQASKQAADLLAHPASSSGHSHDQSMSVGSMQSDSASGQTSGSTVAPRSAGHCEPYSSDREPDLISLSPPARAADSRDSAASLGAPSWLGQKPPAGANSWPPPVGVKSTRPGLAGAQGERLREARRKGATEHAQIRALADSRPAWNAGPAARPPPRCRKPAQIALQPAQPLGRRDDLSPILAEHARPHGDVTARSVSGGAVARLAAQRAGSRRPAAKASSASVQVPHAADRLQQAGQQAQLMSQPSDAAGQVESAAHREAHAQNRLRTKVIAELQNHKRQLAEELEAAVGENAALREAVARGGRAKEQVDQLLDALRREREAHHSAAQQAQRAQEDCARAQQRVKALVAKQAMDRDHVRKLEARLAEKARMLEQLYSTTKDLKAQYEASQQDTAQAAWQASAAVQHMRMQLAQHQQELAAAQESMQAAAAAATRAEERCEELHRDLRTEQEARKAAEAALEAMQDDMPNQGSPPTSTTSQAIQEAEQAWNLRRVSDGGEDGDSLQAELSEAHRRADELQLRLDDSVAEARRYRQRAKWLTAEVAAFRGRIAGHVDEEVLEEVAATPDAGAAGTGYVGEARARLLDEQESLRRQLHAQEMKAAESRRAHALAVEVAELKQQLAALQAPDDKSPSSLSQCTPRRSTSDGGSLQEVHVSSVKEAFEAMSSSGGWSVYDNRVARRVSAGGSSVSA